MINAWSLLYDELYGDDEMTEKNNDEEIVIKFTDNDNLYPIPDLVSGCQGEDYIGISTISDGADFTVDTTNFTVGLDTNFSFDISDASPPLNTSYTDSLNLNLSGYTTENNVTFNTADDDLFASMDYVGVSTAVSLGELPTPGIESNNPRKYKEDEAIKALQDYISTTYGGHYTSKENNVQTLDLIESVGDAESFCRSNAIKYLSRYDKKGQAKRDILKALHYSLLLYHFSGQLKETTTRGYETF